MIGNKPKYVPDSAYVQVRKVLPYTITPIKDLDEWKAMRAQINAEAETTRLNRVQNVKDALQSGQVDVDAAKALQAVLDAEAATYKAIATFRAMKHKSYKNACESVLQPGYAKDGLTLDIPSPTPTFAERLKAAAQSLWKAAFPE